jgi:hypothetical protein
MHLPFGGEKRRYRPGEEIGRAVGAVEHAQLPFAGHGGSGAAASAFR